MDKIKIIKCCRCQKEFNYFSSPFRPFCSEQCKMIDLGLWLSESYSVPAEKVPEEIEIDVEEGFDEEN